jgi:hypothetical protein
MRKQGINFALSVAQLACDSQVIIVLKFGYPPFKYSLQNNQKIHA